MVAADDAAGDLKDACVGGVALLVIDRAAIGGGGVALDLAPGYVEVTLVAVDRAAIHGLVVRNDPTHDAHGAVVAVDRAAFAIHTLVVLQRSAVHVEGAAFLDLDCSAIVIVIAGLVVVEVADGAAVEVEHAAIAHGHGVAGCAIGGGVAIGFQGAAARGIQQHEALAFAGSDDAMVGGESVAVQIQIQRIVARKGR